VVAVAGHVLLTRLRIGWHIMAIGGSRRSAYNSGIAVRRTVMLCYIASGVLTAWAAASSPRAWPPRAPTSASAWRCWC
jgi:ribose transport system permease protein